MTGGDTAPQSWRRAGPVVVCPDRAALAAEAARRMRAAIRDAVAARGVARIAVSGGTTPLPAYRRLAEDGRGFADTEWFWVDERCVPPEHARSNYRAVLESLLGPGAVPAERVHRMRGELEPRAAAATYAALLCARFEVAADESLVVDGDGRARIVFDLIVAGVGNDGHTASLFPGTASVGRSDVLVADVDPGGDLERRITLTRPVLAAARSILVLASGAAKRPVVAAARTLGSEEEIPARLFLAARSGAVTWIVDRDAAPNPVSLAPEEPVAIPPSRPPRGTA